MGSDTFAWMIPALSRSAAHGMANTGPMQMMMVTKMTMMQVMMTMMIMAMARVEKIMAMIMKLVMVMVTMAMNERWWR